MFDLLFNNVKTSVLSINNQSLIVNFAFLGALAACFYSIIQTVLGRYAEIPTISEAASSQIR